MSFGLSDKYIKLLQSHIQEIFGTDTDLKVYLFGSRATGKNKKNSDIDLAFKSKDKDLDKKISKLKISLEESDLPYKVDLVNWDEILTEYFSTINKQKKLFWTKKSAVIQSQWRLCPLGYHWVKEHLKSRNTDPTNSHCRKNPKGKDILTAEEIKKIPELDIFKNPKIKASPSNMGYKHFDKKVDIYINGWCEYWNETLSPKEPLHPNYLKALIASESGFEQNPPRTKGHIAIGISQLMPKTIKLLSSRSKELQNHFVELSEDDAFDLNVNIAAATRWLFRKRETIKKRNPTWLEVFEEYKGIFQQKGPESDKIRKKIREEYLKLEPDAKF